MSLRHLPSLVIALLLAAAACAWADPEGSHPLSDRPFPGPPGLRMEAPCALLIWRKGDSNGLKRLGEAKLRELVSQRPDLQLYACEVTARKAALLPPAPGRLIRQGHVPDAYLKVLQTSRTPFIVTVDRRGLIHRFSYVDHWPVLSAVEARFGPPPAPPKSWWQRVRGLFGLD